MEELKYIVEDSTIAKLLGVQNFTTDESAILELIKNAYDAKALTVTLRFDNDNLEIIDDGIGMNSENIKTSWMHIGKSNKEYEIIDQNNKKRVQAGSKGIGRFALARLGTDIVLYTKTKGSKGVIWKTDWEISTLEEDKNNKNIGTKIVIKNLRERWETKRIKNLSLYLQKTYKDTSMKIRIISKKIDEMVSLYFPKPKPGINCRSAIKLKYKNGKINVLIESDEFEEEAKNYCKEINLKKYQKSVVLLNELKGVEEIENYELEEKELAKKLVELGSFSAEIFFNLNASNVDKEKFLYKYLQTPESISKGVILYRNAFSISSYEGEKDWLGLGKRSRKSPAAATHPTGSWRVRENQISGFVQIDKNENKRLEDLSNRQGLDENIYYKLFIQIIWAGLKEFERYRQNIIRNINRKNKIKKTLMPLLEKILQEPDIILNLTSEEKKQFKEDLKLLREENKKHKEEKANVEKRYKYDVRILNVLATIGLKASSIAHELRNDKNAIYKNYNYIIEALKEYKVWDIVNNNDNRKKAYKDIPLLLKNNNKISKKIFVFINTMLSEIEKKQFKPQNLYLSVAINALKSKWENDYSWITINIDINKNLSYKISEDLIQVILDNLILNSIQQNESSTNLNIDINADIDNGLISFAYSDNGKGLDKKYIYNPRKILEVHETTRANGHGLGMWIVNNTIVMSGGEIKNIGGKGGFCIAFTIGDKN